VFRDDSDEALETAQDRTVDDNRPGHDGLVGGAIPQIETLGQLEVELDGRALERAPEGVADGDIDLGAVEGAVTRIELPLSGVVLVEGLGKLL
jgi:hypothetical protein